MTKSYQIKINQGKTTEPINIPQAGPKSQAVTVKAVAGARYQLIDPETGFSPENIRASRQGKDLKVSFEGSKTTDLVIEDYYAVSPEGYNGLVGEAESGRFYEYIPENASGLASVPMLADSGPAVGMALGGAEVAPAGAAVGVLAAGLFSPGLLGAGALGLAAAGGGGGSSSTGGGTTTGNNANAKIQINSFDDGLATTDKATGSKDTGVSSKDFYTADNTLTYFGKVSGFTSNGDQVKLELKDGTGKIIGTAYVTPDASGNWTWNDQGNPHLDGTYKLEASIVDRAGNTVNPNNGGFASQQITIDNTALVSDAKPILTLPPTQSGSTPVIQKIEFAKLLEDGSFDLYFNDIKFHGTVNSGVISLQNKNFTQGNNLTTGFTSDTAVTGESIHLDFTDLAGNFHKDLINLTGNNYLIGNTIDIGFIA